MVEKKPNKKAKPKTDKSLCSDGIYANGKWYRFVGRDKRIRGMVEKDFEEVKGADTVYYNFQGNWSSLYREFMPRLGTFIVLNNDSDGLIVRECADVTPISCAHDGAYRAIYRFAGGRSSESYVYEHVGWDQRMGPFDRSNVDNTRRYDILPESYRSLTQKDRREVIAKQVREAHQIFGDDKLLSTFAEIL